MTVNSRLRREETSTEYRFRRHHPLELRCSFVNASQLILCALLVLSFTCALSLEPAGVVCANDSECASGRCLCLSSDGTPTQTPASIHQVRVNAYTSLPLTRLRTLTKLHSLAHACVHSSVLYYSLARACWCISIRSPLVAGASHLSSSLQESLIYSHTCVMLCLRDQCFHLATHQQLAACTLYLCVCAHTCMQACMYACKPACMHASMRACEHACMHARMDALSYRHDTHQKWSYVHLWQWSGGQDRWYGAGCTHCIARAGSVRSSRID